ncbi:MAG: NAD(P)/FAD-dependent oxidoreductase [Thermosynechococcaceae cyanobacterium]
MKPDYLIVGSGLSALVFGALMANNGKTVQILEAHEHPGGFGHTFTLANKYSFNAQLHYVWDCGEGQTVNRVLKKLELDREVTFERYDPDGFDHMRMPGYKLNMPSDPEELIRRLSALFPDDSDRIRQFVKAVETTGVGMKKLLPPIKPWELLKHPTQVLGTVQYLNSTLQDVFDKFKLPQAAQTLLALQWFDFLLPPDQLSFYAWVALIRGYQAGAFYATQHFEQVINSLVKVIESRGGQVLLNHEVTQFKVTGRKVTGVEATDLLTHETHEFTGDNVICNIDPQRAAKMIGESKFSPKVRRKLDYEYSASNFMAYCVVKDLELRDYGFGKWNLFHSGHQSLNEAFAQMYDRNDFSNPSFGIATPTLLTNANRDCPEDCQIIEFVTVANYDYFNQLKQSDRQAYYQRKQEILDSILDVVEKCYVPNFRKHMVFHVTGSPTTNERYCWCPQGNSYGSKLTPQNMGPRRLNHETSLDHFYFCNASSGYPGFAPTIGTGAQLYQRLSGDVFLGVR